MMLGVPTPEEMHSLRRSAKWMKIGVAAAVMAAIVNFVTEYLLTSQTLESGWIPVGRREGVSTIYAKPAAARSPTGSMEITVLTDFEKPQAVEGRQILSTIAQVECDCRERTWRSLRVSYFASRMGKGGTAWTGGPSQWVPVKFGTGAEGIWRAACDGA